MCEPQPVKIYASTWSSIPREQWPAAGQIFVCRDDQERMYSDDPEENGGWAVAIMGDGTLENDIVDQGLFWRRSDAELFAAALHGN